MSTLILLGGNGYIGREFSRQWLENHRQDHIITISRSGKNSLEHPQISNIVANIKDFQGLLKKLPTHADYVIDFVGAPTSSEQKNQELNYQPAHTMQKLAEHYSAQAMGYIGGVLGPKKFTQTKKDIIAQLSTSRIPLAVVEPTLVYGAGRSDVMSKLVPFFKFLGIFSQNLKPVTVNEVCSSLIAELNHRQSER